MAILTRSGRIAIAQAIANQPIHLGWGTGGEDWSDTNIPPEDTESTALINEVGRRTAHQVSFCEASETGDIITTSGRFQTTETPSNSIYLEFRYDFDDGVGHTIREVGVFSGSEMLASLPEGQRYFLPNEIENEGTLLQLEHQGMKVDDGDGNLIWQEGRFPSIARSSSTRETLEFVITF